MSASLIKTMTGCSWQFWAKYFLKLPDITNEGALRGDICHRVFQGLGREDRKKLVQKVIKDGTIWKTPSLGRMVTSFCKKNGINDDDNRDLVDFMTLAGLNYDFEGRKHFGIKPTESFSEIDFDIEVKENGKDYRIRGFIDKLFLFKKQGVALIRDFKSSKSVYEGDEVDDNIQDLIYRLAVRRMYPEYADIEMEFVFLKFDCSRNGDGIIRTPNISPEELGGFEHYLTELQQQVNHFGEEDAKTNYAYHQGFPEKEEGFTKRLLCGFNKFKGQKKKDGSVMWGCACKWPMEYYEVKNTEGELIRGLHLTEKDKARKYRQQGFSVKKKKYQGCPVFNPHADVFL